MRRKLLQLLFVFSLCILVIPGCADAQTADQTTQQAPAQSSGKTVKSTGSKIYLVRGHSVKLTVKGADGKEKWKSANKKVARIDNRNQVTAVAPGKTSVKTKVGKKKYKCKVVVMDLSKTNLSLKKGTSKKIKVKNGGNKVKWTSSNKAVCKVSAGKIKAVGEGEAVISARANGKTLKCLVKVPSVIFSTTKLTTTRISAIAGGSSYGTTARIYTSGFTGTPVFSSSNPSVASVSPEGEITGLKSGTSRIKVTADKLTYSTIITVKDRPVDVFLDHLNEYSEFVKKNADYITRNESPTETYAKAKELVSKKKKVKVNCRAGITWAFTEMGITTGSKDTSTAIYAKNGTFAERYTGNALLPSNIQNYMIWIKEGEIVGKTVKEAVNAGLLQPGDICCFQGRTHTFTYSGSGYKFYDGGSICEMTGYGKIGLLLDYSTGKSKKYTFDSQDRLISEVLRWR
jgi:hypothetical protein